MMNNGKLSRLFNWDGKKRRRWQGGGGSISIRASDLSGIFFPPYFFPLSTSLYFFSPLSRSGRPLVQCRVLCRFRHPLPPPPLVLACSLSPSLLFLIPFTSSGTFGSPSSDILVPSTASQLYPFCAGSGRHGYCPLFHHLTASTFLYGFSSPTNTAQWALAGFLLSFPPFFFFPPWGFISIWFSSKKGGGKFLNSLW